MQPTIVKQGRYVIFSRLYARVSKCQAPDFFIEMFNERITNTDDYMPRGLTTRKNIENHVVPAPPLKPSCILTSHSEVAIGMGVYTAGVWGGLALENLGISVTPAHAALGVASPPSSQIGPTQSLGGEGAPARAAWGCRTSSITGKSDLTIR